jgi:hypothetical protein
MVSGGKCETPLFWRCDGFDVDGDLAGGAGLVASYGFTHRREREAPRIDPGV